MSILSPSTKTRHARTYILYILNDVLYHSKSDIFQSTIGAFIPLLVANAWGYKRMRAQVEIVVSIWKDRQYFPSSLVDNLLNEKEIKSLLESKSKSTEELESNEPPEILGRAGASFYDLPASTTMRFISMSSCIPPDVIKPVRLQLDPKTGNFTQQVLDAAERFYKAIGYTSRFREADEEGDQDEVVYQGWTVELYEKDEQRQRVQENNGDNERERGRLSPYSENRRSRSYSSYSSRSRSRSRTRSQSPRRSTSKSEEVPIKNHERTGIASSQWLPPATSPESFAPQQPRHWSASAPPWQRR